MAAPKSVWGIDIGQCALKALKLREVGGQLEAEAFEIIEHPKLLSEPDADRDELIRNSLEEFLTRNDVTGCHVAVAVPGQSSFTRFVKMPPVDPKKIPDLVRFEAEQQIPFDINEVIWRWQSFADPDSPEVEVGLFAMKRTDVYSVLDPFTEMLVGVDTIQMAPLALYNFMTYDQQIADEGATLLVDIGADGTDLVVADGPRLWTRTIQLGGNNFTEALVKAFKLSFAKAEKLKRTAATSKYARQVFQAMRPIFADLVQEIQRSIGYYTSLHRDARFTRILGVGNGFRLPGLQKFLEQNLSTPVIRVDTLNALQPSAMVSAPEFTENILSFAVAYGLAVQGLELTKVDTNLLPNEIASARRWRQKRPWFAAAAALLVVATLGWGWREYSDYSVLRSDRDESDSLRSAKKIAREYKTLDVKYRQVKSRGPMEEQEARKLVDLLKYRPYWPSITKMVTQSIKNVAGNQGDMVASKAEFLSRLDPDDQKCIILTSLTSEYVDAPANTTAAKKLLDEDGTSPVSRSPMGMYGPGFMGGPMGGGGGGAPTGPRAIRLILSGRTPMSMARATPLLNRLVTESKALSKAYFGTNIELMDCKLMGLTRGTSSATATPGGRAPAAVAAGTGTGATHAYGAAAGMYGPGAAGMYGPGAAGMFGPGAAGVRGGLTGGSRPMMGGLGADVLEMDKDMAGNPIASHTSFKVGWILKITEDDPAGGPPPMPY